MQGKALVALSALLVALALVACGGGGDETSTSAAGGASAGSGEEARQPPALEQLERRADEIKDERAKGESGKAGETEDPGDSQRPAPKPPVEHDDSGGGAVEFRSKGGDNSIQGFGQEASASERQGAAAVLHAYLDARAGRRWDEACSYLSAETVASMERLGATAGREEIDSCPEVLATLSAGTADKTLKEGAQADVGSLRAQGTRGFLLYHGPRGADYAIAVVEEGGQWKLASPEATPLL